MHHELGNTQTLGFLVPNCHVSSMFLPAETTLHPIDSLSSMDRISTNPRSSSSSQMPDWITVRNIERVTNGQTNGVTDRQTSYIFFVLHSSIQERRPNCKDLLGNMEKQFFVQIQKERNVCDWWWASTLFGFFFNMRIWHFKDLQFCFTFQVFVPALICLYFPVLSEQSRKKLEYIRTYISASIDCEWVNNVLVHMTKSPLIFPHQVVLIFLVDCFHHVRSADLERHEEPEAWRETWRNKREGFRENLRTWEESTRFQPHWEWRSQWEGPWCHLSILSFLPESPSDHFLVNIQWEWDASTITFSSLSIWS